ncbi:MAG: DUF11 domain-containing protein [Sphingomonadales bacterium]|nr:MAG: DUF11 domain-containing protein [Sphingomonadales bacterium]
MTPRQPEQSLKQAAQIRQSLMRWQGVSLAVAACVLAAPDPAIAQLRSLENPSFEGNDPAGPGAPNFEVLPSSAVPGWETTTNEIELWDSNFNGVPAFAGNVFAEMNANVNGTFFQNICLINGEPISWTFAHRARAGGPSTQTVRFQVASSTGTLRQSLATQSSRTNNLVWNVNTGTATYSGPSGMQRVQFTTSDPGSFGNFLDAIQLSLRPFVQLSAATASSTEATASAALPTLLVTGSLQSAITVPVAITGGTAVRGTDYTTPGGGATFNVTIPAGTYFNSPIPLGISITDDTAIESSETITFALSAGSGVTLSNTTTCGAGAQTSGSYTITDNDARVTMRKQWVNAVPGDDTTLTVARGASGIDTFASDAGSAGELDTDLSPTPAVIGETLTLSEQMAVANLGSYQSAIACTGTSDTVLSDGLTIGPGETAITCTYTNTRIIPLQISKTSFVLTDGLSPTDPKAIPGAIIRYCILVANPGTIAASGVSVTDTLAASLAYIPGSARTGTDCATATTPEDDNATGSDESDPIGTAFTGSTLTGSADSLDAGASFAITLDAVLN